MCVFDVKKKAFCAPCSRGSSHVDYSFLTKVDDGDPIQISKKLYISNVRHNSSFVTVHSKWLIYIIFITF